ncbi:hypothetical protein QYE76_063103 [Lolium multiflorum]|uniref:Uncharacterized protein n=1 Tax=Lolium multiflorum TaxID=4521 RepID=A0AAD8S5R7_LOLMU|nr:hypothetical protein QYE76_063103 [Lolium multiflorum]
MSSSGTPKDSFFENVVNPYMNKLKMHPKELLLVDGELQIEDVRGPKGEGSLEDRMEKLEQEVFTYKKMAKREVDIFHKIMSELIEHKKETAKLWDDILSLHNTTNKLQAQLYDVQNQNLPSIRLPFDGRSSLYAAGSLLFDAREVVVHLADEDSSSCSKREYMSAIKFAVHAELHHLREFITTAATELRSMVDLIAFFASLWGVLCKFPCQLYFRFGRRRVDLLFNLYKLKPAGWLCARGNSR